MPVGTQATVKGLTPAHLADELDARLVLANTYHLYIRPGHQTIERLGGLHRFMNWDRAILTDSGGFQVFSLNDLRRITEIGVTFQSHLDGSSHSFTPENVVDIQLALHTDIAMVLDECIGYPATWEHAKNSTDRTMRWARRSFEHYRARPQSATALFPIVQGGMFEDLRRTHAEQLLDLDADGYAIGGLSVGEPRDVSQEMTRITAPLLPRDRPRYVMGVGLPRELPEYVSHGIDMMDCVLPTRNARHGKLFTSAGSFSIKNAQYREDPAPVDPACGCYTCRNFSRGYLRHLFLAGEQLFVTLATLHNVRRYLDIMREMRDAIINKSFPSYLRSVRASAPASPDAAG
jgi:queuine tRNA-ribosyltransferase